MAFTKGKSGNPGGRPKTLIWRNAIHHAVKRVSGGGDTRQLDLLADSLVAAALGGDISALREIGDRLDGKPTQAVAVEGDTPLFAPHIIVRFDEPQSLQAE